MPSLPIVVIKLIADQTHECPLVYLILAAVSRNFYLVYMSDLYWRKFDAYGRKQGIAADFVEKVLYLHEKMGDSKDYKNWIRRLYSKTVEPEELESIDGYSSAYEALAAASLDGSTMPFYKVPLDENLAICIVGMNWRCFSLLPAQWNSSKPVILAAAAKGNIIDGIRDTRLVLDRDIMFALVKIEPRNIEKFPHCWDDKELVLAAVKRDGRMLGFASDRLKNDREVCFAAGTDGFLASDAQFYEDRDYVVNALRGTGFGDHIRGEGVLLAMLPERFQDDDEIVGLALRWYGAAIQFATPRLKRNKQLILSAPPEKRAAALQAADPILRDDKEFILKLLECKGMSLAFASDRLRSDRQVVQYAVDLSPSALSHAGDELRADYNLVAYSISKWGAGLDVASPKLCNNKDLVQLAVEADGLALRFASEELQSDVDVVRAAIGNNESAIAYALINVRQLNLP